MVFGKTPHLNKTFTEGSKEVRYWEFWLELCAFSEPDLGITEALAAAPFLLLTNPQTGKPVWRRNKRVLYLRPELRKILSGFLGETSDADILTGQSLHITSEEQLSWEVLPPGWWRNPELVNRLLGHNERTPEDILLISRLQFVDSLQPRECYSSKPSLGNRFGDRTYFVFIFDNHVVAECPQWGNAIYVIKGTKDWQVLLKHSKRELLDLAKERVTRILHSGEWKARLCFALNKPLPTELFSTPEHT